MSGSSGYRQAIDIWRDEQKEITAAAENLVNYLGLPFQHTYVDQAKILVLSLIVNAERNASTHDAWRAVGFTGNLLTAYGKLVRLMNTLFWNNESRAESKNEKPLDNAVDGIVYLGFFSRQFLEGDSHGAPPIFTPKAPVEQEDLK